MNFKIGLFISAVLIHAIAYPQDLAGAAPPIAQGPPTVEVAPPATELERDSSSGSDSESRALGSIFDQLEPFRQHFVDHTRDELETRRRESHNYAILTEERRSGKWHAALVSDKPTDRWSISERFDSLTEMRRYFRERDAVVEIWGYAENGRSGRRLTSHEAADWSKRRSQRATYQTATFQDKSSGGITGGRLEFGIGAASESLKSALGYQHHRNLQVALRRVLRTRDAHGNLSAKAQWEALRLARRSGSVPIREMPAQPEDDLDVLHAFECSTTLDGQISVVLRAFKASEISPRMIDGLAGIELGKNEGGNRRSAVLYNPSPPDLGDETQLVAQGTEVRIRNPDIDDPRRWNRLEFGEPSLLRRQGIANFGLINAHMEGARKGLAMKKAKIDRIAEPVFAGLNIGGGLAGVGAPLGESARLGYNLLLGRKYLPNVPSVDEFRDLFAIHLAKSQDAHLQTRIPANLSRSEMRKLRSAATQIDDRTIDDQLRSVNDDDLAAMLQLPRRQSIDQKYRLFADILTDLAKVTGESQSGIVRDIFGNQRVSLSGELSLTTTLALAFGEESVTPLSGSSLKELADGEGPARAWLQYFNVSLDLRAIANTVYLLRKRSEIDRELRKPFANAPRVSDLAAYEIRIFGYPLLLQYKRGLLEDDMEAYKSNYAYGVLGTKVVTRFPTQSDFDREIRSGNMITIGLVRIAERRGFLRRRRVESNLPVFGYRIPDGEHAGETAIIIYGMSAHRSYSQLMEREALRFGQFEQILKSGGVIERLVAAEDPDDLPPMALEPVLAVNPDIAGERFSNLLSDLIEYDRHVKFAKWNIARTPAEEVASRETAKALRSRGIDADPRSSPLIEVGEHFESFVYRKRINGRWRLIEAIHFPSKQEIQEDIDNRALEAQIEHERLGTAADDSLSSQPRP